MDGRGDAGKGVAAVKRCYPQGATLYKLTHRLRQPRIHLLRREYCQGGPKHSASRLSVLCETEGRLFSLKNRAVSDLNRSTTDMAFAMRRLQELGRAYSNPLRMRFVDLQKAYDCVNIALLWDVFVGYGMP